MKVTLVTTVYNEEKNIRRLLESIRLLSKKPDEIIIVDGGSKDKTVSIIQEYSSEKKLGIALYVKKGNRSIGRNEAIKKATSDIIAITDAGCILDSEWLENIIKPFKDPKVEVVSGYYKGIGKSVFQKCLIPYALVMPDQVKERSFLPATRSMAIRKYTWKRLGGFAKEYSHNEDYVFAKKLEDKKIKTFFAYNAIVKWIPRKTFKEAFIMFFRFSYGDAEANILRNKVLLLFARYFLGIYIVLLAALYKSVIAIILLIVVFVLYLLWAIWKNYKYVRERKAILILPLLQLTADLAVISGTSFGFFKRLRHFKLLNTLKKNKIILVLIIAYCLIELLFISWGTPNSAHPFPYHMDEWHQLQAIRATIGLGTPNVPGSANSVMFHFITSGLYLVPFTLMGFVNPQQIKIDDFVNRQNIFFLLRLNTILYGVLSIFLVYYVSKVINGSKNIATALFVTSPIWLALSGYFKYDIALSFWILLSIYFSVLHIKNPTRVSFIVSAIPMAIALSLKVSAAPLVLVYLLLYFLIPFKNKNVLSLFLGLGLFSILVLLFGIPDTLFGKGNIIGLLFDVVIAAPRGFSNYILEQPVYIYLFLKQYPLMFGYGLSLVFIVSFITFAIRLITERFNIAKYRIEVFLLISLLIFIASTLSIKIYAAGNRTLVFLPFMVLFMALEVSRLFKSKHKALVRLLIVFALVIQIAEAVSFLSIKQAQAPQEQASKWMIENITRGERIGIENIPIYQYMPDVINKEFYYKLNGEGQHNKYNYEVIDFKTKVLPSVIVISNSDMEKKLLKESPKNSLIERLENENYIRVANFKPTFSLYNYFGNEADFYMAGIITVPTSISFYRR